MAAACVSIPISIQAIKCVPFCLTCVHIAYGMSIPGATFEREDNIIKKSTHILLPRSKLPSVCSKAEHIWPITYS